MSGNFPVREKMAAMLRKQVFLYNWLGGKGLYIAIGMLTLSTVLLVGVLISMKPNSWGTTIGQDQAVKQEVSTNEVAAKVIEVVPQPITVALPREVPKEESVNSPTEFRSMKGLIKLDFGWQMHPLYQDWRYHTGMDIAGVEEQAVYAICSGEVTDVSQDRNTGLTVVVKNNGYRVYYGSLSGTAISKGSHVGIGQEIGKMGICDTEPYYHVHLAIKKGEQAIDPKVVFSNE